MPPQQQAPGALKAVRAYGNFAKAQIDHDMMGRFDLPAYSSGMDVFQNFISNFKGNAIFSSGFISELAFQDCAFVEFKFGITQNYLCAFYASAVQFAAFDTSGNFGWVLSGGVPLVVSSPYTLADAKTISLKGSYTQNADVMYIFHRSYDIRKLTRTGASSFTLATYSRTGDPFTGANSWPGAGCFYQGRLYCASTNNNLTGIWFSNDGAYDDFTIQSPITDASGFAFTCTDITQQIEWLFPADVSLIAGSTDGIIAVNGGGPSTAITPATVQANITSAQPCSGAYPCKKDGLLFYTGRIGRNIYYFKFDIFTQMFIALDANLSAYDITRGGIGKLRPRRDKYDLIFTMRGDNVLLSMCFNQYENINGWNYRNTPGASGNDAIKDIAVMGDNVGNPQLFVLVNRDGNFFIEMQAPYVEFKNQANFWTQNPADPTKNPNQEADTEAYLRYVSEQLRQCNYLDNSIYYADLRTSTITFTQTGTDPTTGAPTGNVVSNANDFSSGDVGKHIVYQTATGYESGRFQITAYTSATTVSVLALQNPQNVVNGTAQPLDVWSAWYKSFLTVSGLDQYDGNTVGVVLDGGYDGPQVISGGAITLAGQTTSICIGYLYTGIIKSMCIGFQLQGSNTQITLKEISRISMRCVNTLGLKVGSSLYDLQEVQLRTPSDINYLPPAPIDGTQDIDVDSDSEEDFFFYAVQDVPQPANIANYFLEANYALNT